MLKLTTIVLARLLAAGAYSLFKPHSKAAVEQAINDHLAQNPNLKSDTRCFPTRPKPATMETTWATADC